MSLTLAEPTMLMKLPSARYLGTLGRQAFESENALQKFFEKKVWPVTGLRVVCSSRRNHGRLGNIDTIALDKRNRPVVIEYKRDVVDQRTLGQLARYRNWLLDNKGDVERAAGVAIDWTRIYLVSVGHKYDGGILWPSFPGTRIRPLRYGYEERIVVLKRVKPGNRPTYGEERAHRFS